MTVGQLYVPYSAGCAVRWLIMQKAQVPTALYQPALFDMAWRIDRYFNRRSQSATAELYLLCSAGESWLELPGGSMLLPSINEDSKYIIGLTAITCGTNLIWQQPPMLSPVKK